jgi:hypothetical protein
MKSIVIKTTAVLALAVATLVFANTAEAAHVVVDLTVPEQPAIGQPATITARFHADTDQSAIAGLEVAFHEEVTFAGVTSDVDLGSAVTDSNGEATLVYEPRVAGTHEIHVRYAYGDGAEEEDAVASLTVPAGGQQLHQSTAGVKITGLNVWLLMALVATVWAVLLSVAFRVIAIAHTDEVPVGGR